MWAASHVHCQKVEQLKRLFKKLKKNVFCGPLYRTGHVIKSDFPGLPSIQVRSSHCDECAPNTRSIVGLDFCDIGDLEGSF